MSRSAAPFLPLSIPRAGRCGICSEPALLTHIDNATAIKFGRCCAQAMLSAEALILYNRRNGGPRPPKPGELSFLDNH